MIVYAPSFAGLVQSLKISSISDLHVISSNLEICSFCEEMNIKYTNLKLDKPSKLRDFITQKKRIKNFSKTINNMEVLFCFYGFDILGLYFIYQIKNKNKVYFENKDHIYSQITFFEIIKLKSFYKILDLFIPKLLFNPQFNYFSISNKKQFIGISPEKLRKDFSPLSERLNLSIFETNKHQISKIQKIPLNSVIFIDEGNNTFDLPNNVIDWIEDNYEFGNFFVKPHPNFNLSNEKLSKFTQIKKNIPMELLITSDLTLIGISSTVLLDESIECKKISLIKLVKWKSPFDEENANRILSKLISTDRINLIKNI